MNNLVTGEEHGTAARLLEFKDLRIAWVGQRYRRPVGSRKMLPAQSFIAALGCENCVGLNYDMCPSIKRNLKLEDGNHICHLFII